MGRRDSRRENRTTTAVVKSRLAKTFRRGNYSSGDVIRLPDSGGVGEFVCINSRVTGSAAMGEGITVTYYDLNLFDEGYAGCLSGDALVDYTRKLLVAHGITSRDILLKAETEESEDKLPNAVIKLKEYLEGKFEKSLGEFYSSIFNGWISEPAKKVPERVNFTIRTKSYNYSVRSSGKTRPLPSAYRDSDSRFRGSMSSTGRYLDETPYHSRTPPPGSHDPFDIL